MEEFLIHFIVPELEEIDEEGSKHSQISLNERKLQDE